MPQTHDPFTLGSFKFILDKTINPNNGEIFYCDITSDCNYILTLGNMDEEGNWANARKLLSIHNGACLQEASEWLKNADIRHHALATGHRIIFNTEAQPSIANIIGFSGQSTSLMLGRGLPLTCFMVSKNSQYLIGSTFNSRAPLLEKWRINIWDLQNHRSIMNNIVEPLYGIRPFAVSKDCRYLATMSVQNHTFFIYVREHGQVVSSKSIPFLGDGGSFVASNLVMSDDGEHIIWGLDNTIRVWSWRHNQEIILTGHTQSVNWCVLTSNHRYIISASSDFTLRVWDIYNRECVAIVEEHTAQVFCCALSHNNQYLISSSADGTVKIWRSFLSHDVLPDKTSTCLPFGMTTPYWPPAIKV